MVQWSWCGFPMVRRLLLANSELDPALSAKAASVRRRLLPWFARNGRGFLWREDTSAYIVLISEILLKKTTAQMVDRFLPQFLREFPDMEALARVRMPKLRRALKPLGLSRQRSIQLRSLASTLVSIHGGRIPRSQEGLLGLPGVGLYTANSVLCVAFGKAAPVVDTNVARIIVRVFGVSATRREPRRCPLVWKIAEAVSGDCAKTARSTNWALLDIGASLCLPRNPKCGKCPLRTLCEFALTVNARET